MCNCTLKYNECLINRFICISDENWLEIYQFSQELLRNYTAEHMYYFYADFQ